ncbi:LysR substrate-binding domain-containing protein [Vibrio spartinae]|uniref:Hydrogen peroxide-inducible genes activator n=1 Tax=Vibrio spartinae TaxID=1918945 RepID=A0A1N6MBT1_9VIBR|nr:LysR substrate-binding domain-containing protein [Vibrio spartinae]SIO96891.1 Hydrogen peroxide-inducible genes activator [Vibrio spartinae]
MRSLDLDSLRCFVLGIELGSFAKAASRLNRSAAAASAQLKKLEQQCGAQLTIKNGRHLRPTQEGEVILGYARRMIQLNDEVISKLKDTRLSGCISCGLHEDFSDILLPKLLNQVSKDSPQLEIQAIVGRHSQLLESIESGELDFALGWENSEIHPYSESLGNLNLHWYGPADSSMRERLSQMRPLPLVMFANGCSIRTQATEALDHTGIPWNVNFVGHNLKSLWQAVEAGLGLTVRSSFDIPQNIARINNLPKPGSLKICINRSQRTLNNEKQTLYNYLKNKLLQHIELIS